MLDGCESEKGGSGALGYNFLFFLRKGWVWGHGVGALADLRETVHGVSDDASADPAVVERAEPREER